MTKGMPEYRVLFVYGIFLAMVLLNITSCSKQEDRQSSEPDQNTISSEAEYKKDKGDAMVVENGSRIKVHYSGTLEDGTVFDSSLSREPLEFVVGEGLLIPGFEKAVMGMKVNEEKEVNIAPEDGYGERDSNLVMRFPLSSAPEDFTPELGAMIQLQDQEGRAVPGVIVGITNTDIDVDMNPPLAGKTLTFKIKVVSIE